MQNLLYILLLVLLFACKSQNNDNIDPCAKFPTIRQEFSTSELKWQFYMKKDTIYFVNSNKQKEIFVTIDSDFYYGYRAMSCFSCYYGVLQLYLINLNRQSKITELYSRQDKDPCENINSDNGKPSETKTIHNNSFTLYNKNSATGLVPTAGGSTSAGCIELDRKDQADCYKTYILLPSLVIGNKKYENVYQMKVKANPNIGATYLYVNQDFGFLRIDFADGEVWERVN